MTDHEKLSLWNKLWRKYPTYDERAKAYDEIILGYKKMKINALLVMTEALAKAAK